VASREYSRRLGALSDEQLQAALDRFDLGRLVSAEPIANGLFGQNLMLQTSAGEYVFRGAPHWNPAGEDDWQFPKERFFSRLMHDAPGAPVVPWPYIVDEGRDIFGWGFALQPRLPGIVLQQPMRTHYSEREIREQSRELGAALAKLHSLKLPAAGTYERAGDGIRSIRGAYFDYLASTVEQLLAEAANSSPATPAADIDWARGVLDDAREALALPFEPTVVHLDFGFHNVLFVNEDGHWKLSGVVDWMTAEAGHPECDLSRPIATSLQHKIGAAGEFLDAYRGGKPEPAGFEERFRAFMLWERSLIWNYWQRNNGFKEGLTMRAWMEPFVEMLPGVERGHARGTR
jgi:hygromycin-B 7''-O-kinase